ncbi:hypothetical protein [Legionella pneumophila]
MSIVKTMNVFVFIGLVGVLFFERLPWHREARLTRDSRGVLATQTLLSIKPFD